jgi:nucleotide-binding universal stress UspA family protein
MCAVDFSPATDRALAWLKTLMAAGPTSLLLAHVLWPPGEQRRRHAQLKAGEAAPAGDDAIGLCTRDLAERLVGHAPAGARLEVRTNWGRTADFLADWATQAGADLLIVATRHLTGLARVWEGSVAPGLISAATCPVASVPPPADQ